MTLIRADLHTHTIFSPDSMIGPEDYVRRCVAAGIGCVAVTEHDSIDGALYLRAIAPFQVIVAEEVRTTEGEIIGMFLRERVPPKLSPEETVARIREQGGLVVIPHPYDRFRDGLGEAAMLRILPSIDAIEALNGRIRLSRDNGRALAFAEAHGLPVTAGTDAHSPWELGRTYVEMPEFETPQQFMASLRAGRLAGKRAPRWVYAFSTIEKLRRKAGMRGDPPPLPSAAERR